MSYSSVKGCAYWRLREDEGSALLVDCCPARKKDHFGCIVSMYVRLVGDEGMHCLMLVAEYSQLKSSLLPHLSNVACIEF